MRIVAIAQGRSGSQRLPRKILMPIKGEPMIARVVERLRRARLISDVVVATTTEVQDDPVAQLAANRSWNCFRGSHLDVLDRYYRAACEYQAEAVVRITCDCPLIDPGVVDRVVGRFLELQPDVDYVSNTLEPRTFPRGLDTEVFSFDALKKCWEEGREQPCREHVTPYIYRNRDLFRMDRVGNDIDCSSYRWTVDTQEDLDLVRKIYDGMMRDDFSWQEVLWLVNQHPQWSEINREIVQKEVTEH